MNMRSVWLMVAVVAAGLSLGGCSGAQAVSEVESKTVVRPISEIEWGALNPARGDQSPRAADLWGDRKAPGATGFLVKFVDGFSSPPHIHNVTYRGVVIGGNIHNDDPDAAKMWMSTGSYWTQPAGHVHITAAQGDGNIAYIEIGDGPYLVRPTQQAFATDEKPINMDASNVVWIDHAHGTQIAYLWGAPNGEGPSGVLLRLPAGFDGAIRQRGGTLRAVVVEGSVAVFGSSDGRAAVLDPGSYFGGEGAASHRVSCGAAAGCVVYVRSDGKPTIEPR